MRVNERLKEYINSKGIKQTAIAKAIGMKQGTLNAILNGRSSIKVDTLLAISSFLSVDAKFFLMEE